MGDLNKIFNYENRIIFNDNLFGFKDIILKNDGKYYNIYFDFLYIEKSLSKVKKIIINNYKNINFDYLYFYNANDFVNIILEKEIYLPYNVNLFISETCPIGCNYCKNPNDIHIYLSYEKIKSFISKYNVGDNINFNILGQGDPIFNPELLEILGYIKSIGGYVTFFSGGKSLLFIQDFDIFEKNIDEFKINLSASNYKVYNKTHKLKITEKEFSSLFSRFKKIAYKSTFISILLKENISDLIDFFKIILSIGAFGIEIKKNLHYIENDILNNKLICNNVIKIIEKFSKYKNINIISNIGTGITSYNNLNNISKKSILILDTYINKSIIDNKILIEDINKLGKCFQFGNSIDIKENGDIAICCHYDISIVSNSDFKHKLYEDESFINKKKLFNKKTPISCEKCPMPIDRYKNYLKYKIVSEL